MYAAARGRSSDGDALLFRTGWLKVWQDDVDRFNARQPGPSLEAAQWAGRHEVVVMAADNSAVVQISEHLWLSNGIGVSGFSALSTCDEGFPPMGS